jgi:predicted sugar kinase
MTPEQEQEDDKFMKDLTQAITAVSQLHAGINYLLESKMTAHVEFDDGTALDIGLGDAISYAIGLELGITLDELMNCKNRSDLKKVGEKPVIVLKQVLNQHLARRMQS